MLQRRGLRMLSVIILVVFKEIFEAVPLYDVHVHMQFMLN